MNYVDPSGNSIVVRAAVGATLLVGVTGLLLSAKQHQNNLKAYSMPYIDNWNFGGVFDRLITAFMISAYIAVPGVGRSAPGIGRGVGGDDPTVVIPDSNPDGSVTIDPLQILGINDFDQYDFHIEPDPWLFPWPFLPWERTDDEDDYTMTVVELGAGNYSNAIRNKALNPHWSMWATNNFNDRWGSTELIRFYDRMHQSGTLQQDPTIIHTTIVGNFYVAQSIGIQVGSNSENPITNAQIVGMIPNTVDLVYTIAPYPDSGSYESMGTTAGILANQTRSEIYICRN